MAKIEPVPRVDAFFCSSVESRDQFQGLIRTSVRGRRKVVIHPHAFQRGIVDEHEVPPIELHAYIVQYVEEESQVGPERRAYGISTTSSTRGDEGFVSSKSTTRNYA